MHLSPLLDNIQVLTRSQLAEPNCQRRFLEQTQRLVMRPVKSFRRLPHEEGKRKRGPHTLSKRRFPGDLNAIG